MKVYKGGVLKAVAGSSVVLVGLLGLVAPQAAYAKTKPTTTEKGNVTCTVGSFGQYTLPLTVKSYYTTSEPAGGSESLKAKAIVTIPTALNTAEYSAGYRSFNGTVPTVWVDNTDATPSPYNAGTNNTITIPLSQIPSSGTSTLKFTVNTIGPFTFTSSGTDKVIAGDSSKGFAVANVTLYTNSTGSGSGTAIVANCATPPVATGGGAFVIGTITVT